MKIAGHSTVVVSQRYVHPRPESVERAFKRLESLNVKGNAAVQKETKLLPAPTISSTVETTSDIVAQ